MSEEPPPPGTEDIPDGFPTAPVEPVPSTTTAESMANAATSSASLFAAERDEADIMEEGEIEDEDENELDHRGLEYENISSDEELIIRERLAQLQAMDTELGLLNQITGHRPGAKRRNAHNKRMQPPPPPVISDGKENYECISDEEDLELYLRRYDPVPKPKPLPVRRKLRPARVTDSAKLLRQQYAIISSSSRHRVSRDPKRPRTLEKRKHEPRKQSLHRRHKRRKQAEVSSTTVNVVDSSDSERDFPLDRARLQAACSINNSRKHKTDQEQWNALKRKLQLSMQMRKKSQEVAASKEVEKISLDEPMVLDDDEDEEEEEELLQLRLSALKTKAELRETDVIDLLENTPEKAAEEQELRLIALQSAFTKKHQIRLKKRQEERPYSPSDEIQLLSPVAEPTYMAEIIDVDEDLQIVVTRPETVEIADSSDEENRMEISPSVSPQELRPEVTDVQPVDMELATSGESQSPAPEATNQQPEVTPQLDSPVSPTNEEGDLQSKFPEEDDEETLRNQLLLNLSGSLPVARPLTPDSMGEEEVDALRELILSRMNNKRVTKRQDQSQTPPQASEISNETEVSQNIPPTDESPTNSNEVSVEKQPSSKVPTPVAHQSRVPMNPNLITLIGKQKIARKKKKKSAAKLAKQAAAECLPVPMAIAAPPPSRILVKTPIPQVSAPAAVPLVIQPPMITITTTKLVVNPNKLINLNTLNHSPKEHSAIVDSYVQKPVPKLIIQLGQSDSDSDPDYYPDPHSEPEVEVLHETFLRDLDNASPSRVTVESPTFPMSPVPTEVSEHPAPSKTADPAFAQRLDQFLRTVRSQTDQNQNVTETVAKQCPAAVVPSAGSGSNGLGTGHRPTATPRKLITAPAAVSITPSAVRHLPKSQQLEYKRLLARMAHLEKQKQQRIVIQNTPAVVPPGPTLTKTIVNNGLEDVDAVKNHEIVVTVNRDGRDVIDKSSPTVATSGGSPVPKRDTDTLIKRVLINNTVSAGNKATAQATVATVAVQASVPQDAKDETGKSIASEETRQKSPTKAGSRKDKVPEDSDLATLREALRRLPRIRVDDRHRVLKLAEARYENHSKRFRQELQDLIGTVENAQYERQKQYDLENKVAFLREKLMVLERALAVHKHRIVSIFPTLQESHTRVMASRKKSIELNNLCQAIGRSVQGDGYSAPSGLRGEIHQQLKVLTSETKQLKNMKKLTLDEFKQRTVELRRRHQEEVQDQKQNEPSPVPEPEPCPDEPETVDEQSTGSDEVPAKDEEITEEKSDPVPMDVTEVKPCAKSAPASRSTSPLTMLEPEKVIATQEAPAVLSSGPTWKRFEKYTSPLASLRSAPNIPHNGVICPYQMRGECDDKECKFEHLK